MHCRRVCGLPDKAGGPQGLHPGGPLQHPALHHPPHRHADGHRLRVLHTGQHPPGERGNYCATINSFSSGNT